MNRIAALAGCLWLAAGAAWTQAPRIDDVEAVTVEELVVRGRLPGPAWWRVSDSDSTVYVLGLPDALPKGTVWNQTVLNRRLQGADRLITPPVYRARANPLSLPKLLVGVHSASKSKTALDQSLPPELTTRFEQAAVRAGKGSEDYQALRPWFAGMRLASRYRGHVGLDDAQPLRSVQQAARRAKVKSQPAYAVDAKASDLLQEVKSVSDDRGRACLQAAVEEVESGDATIRSAASAWASGDVRIALGGPRSSEICFAALPGAGALKRDSLERQADAIEAALARPGHSVAALSFRSLVAKQGVLERLRARGHTVRAPE